MAASPSPEPEFVDRLRRELILAQTQILELGDMRDELQTRLAATSRLLAQAEQIANQALLERDQTGAALQSALEAREKLAATAEALHSAIAEAKQQLGEAQRREAMLGDEKDRLTASEAKLSHDLDRQVQATANAEQHCAELESEKRAILASRSWRWTAPLRAIERFCLRPKRPR